MSNQPAPSTSDHPPERLDSVEMPRPTVAPLVLSVGMVLLAAGLATSLVFSYVGGALVVVALGTWISHLLPGRGHMHEPLVRETQRAAPAAGQPGTVEQLKPGAPGYRLRLPERVHPISAGIKGGIAGGIVMPIPALAYGVLSGHGIWFPINLLAGMLLPGVGDMSVRELEQFNGPLLAVAAVIHVMLSVVLGLIYGVLLPTLPRIPKPLAWGGLLMPLLWTGVSFLVMGQINPVLQQGVDWPWFIVSQFIFGVVAALVVLRHPRWRPVAAGLAGGVVGGLLMPLPAELWSVATGHGFWYPINLLAGMAVPGLGKLPVEALEQFRGDWFAIAVGIHAGMSAAFGLVYGLLLPRVPPIPAAVAWGGLLLPLLWTATSYGLMGVVNPLLQERVDWPWFVVSQFVFGLVAAMVVLRSEMVHIPPAGRGPDSLAAFLEGT
ncbi:MAG TPA: hypothetical protein VHV55_08285 [Pirellulales bacterium]|jgi:hypothetical protein|nr:hypothetical protein [Pirellulales bacterium]